jgi:hypothetical protein
MRPRRRGRRTPRDSRHSWEHLESRRLLAGITIVTHGHTDNANAWVTEMGNAIAAAAVAPVGSVSEVPQYRVDATQAGGIGTAITVHPHLRTSGPSDWGRTGEVVIKLDWGAIATGLVDSTPTGQVADAFANYLLNTQFDGHRIAELPIHLIGHSRGGSLITRLAQRLGERGIWVDHFTPLDPHPVDGLFGDDVANFNDDPMKVWENVVFADDYFRQGGTFPQDQIADVDGEPVFGAHNQSLQDSVLEFGSAGYNNAAPSHNDVHLWYHGTIGLQAIPFVAYPTNDGTSSIGSNWYSSPHPARDSSGFKFSLIAGGDRPLDGLGGAYGGSADRSTLTKNAAITQWPNIGQISLRHHPSNTTSTGERIFLTYNYSDYDSGATTTWFTDTDTNPYNGHFQQLPDAQTVSTTGPNVSRALYHGSLAGLTPGTYHLYARISDSNGHSRYAYLADKMTITGAAPVPTISSGITKAAALDRDLDVYTFAAAAGGGGCCRTESCF